MPLGAIKSSCCHGPANTYTLTSPLGDLEVVSCPKGIHSVGFVKEITDDNFNPDVHVTVKVKSQLYEDNGYTYKPFLVSLDWFKVYFSGSTAIQTLPLPPLCLAYKKQGTFMRKVWSTLAETVPFGETISYGELATRCGSPHGSRAVGQAMKNNPIGIIVPCHRVVLSGGKLGSYCGGVRNKMKKWLLDYEKITCQ